jgi:hypothetical protein
MPRALRRLRGMPLALDLSEVGSWGRFSLGS